MNSQSEFYPTANVIADSVNSTTGDRVTTMIVEMHRFILPEFNTYRQFSRNFSSSRAIPINKMIDNVVTNNVYPLHFGKNKKGMQASEEVTDINEAKRFWDLARQDAIFQAKRLSDLGVHKQVTNRLLEPFSVATGIVSSTDWNNFFKQRCHPDAQPEIKALADAMFLAISESKAKTINPGDWHIPFISYDTPCFDGLESNREAVLKVSVGRCARVSYLNHNGTSNILDDQSLHDKLILAEPPHLSPFEHQAKASEIKGKFANFNGWKQYRTQLEESKYT